MASLDRTMNDRFAQSGKSPAHWNAATTNNVGSALRAQKLAEEQFQMSMMSRHATRTDNVKQYQNVHSSFHLKSNTTKQLRDLLHERICSVTGSIRLTKQSLAAVQTANQAKQAPLQLCTWRQDQRSQRPSREMIRDPVEIALEEEKEVLRDSQKRLETNSDKTDAMIKMLNKWLDELNFDMHNKAHSHEIDTKCLSTMHRTWPTRGGPSGFVPSGSLSARGGMSARDANLPSIDMMGSLDTGHVPDEGSFHLTAAMHMDQEEKRQNETITRIHKAKEAERAALALREENDKLMQRTNQECDFALQHVEQCLAKRIEETQTMRRNVDKTIEETKRKIAMMMHSISLTGAELQSHEEPMSLNATRGSFRASRTRRENIGDPVTSSMNRHAMNLVSNYNVLESCRSSEGNCLALLQKAKADLEADLSDKTKAMNIDLTCQHRKNFSQKMTFDAMSPHLTRYPRRN